jgi:galactonate dehydratase
MKITSIETLRLGEYPNICFVEINTDDGFVGLGETFLGAQAVEAYILESAASVLLGADPSRIDAHAHQLRTFPGSEGRGAESRGNSAIDIALWDLAGQIAGQPIHQLLGGRTRERIRLYNTCAGYQYIRTTPGQTSAGWGLPDGEDEGPYEDLLGFLERPAELAESLLAQGITGMKIWPFDRFAERTQGHYLSASELDSCLQPFRAIREAVGRDMDLMVELHALWDLPTSKRIARALEEVEPLWLEDALKADARADLAELAAATSIPLAVSETLTGRQAYRDVLEHQAAGVVMIDVSWVGGISEAKLIAGMAEAYHRPITFHDCTGPVVLTASAHLGVNATNAINQEFVRAFYYGWYAELLTDLPEVVDGTIAPPEGPGLGTRLRPELGGRGDAQRRVSALAR